MAREPENLIWENLGLSFTERSVRVALSLVFTATFLLVSFAGIYYAQLTQERLAAEFPPIDCTPYVVRPWDLLNATRLEQGPTFWSNGSLAARPAVAGAGGLSIRPKTEKHPE